MQLVDSHPLDYLNFYCLGNREEIPDTIAQSLGDADKVVVEWRLIHYKPIEGLDYWGRGRKDERATWSSNLGVLGITLDREMHHAYVSQHRVVGTGDHKWLAEKTARPKWGVLRLAKATGSHIWTAIDVTELETTKRRLERTGLYHPYRWVMVDSTGVWTVYYRWVGLWMGFWDGA
ncbi:Phospholipase D [Forsythia ovata]|uniref:Phospholipase D n=1 Tax=Forsythia ovata TaxID=205694 RepID=A0ABD1TLM0_9LAMI